MEASTVITADELLEDIPVESTEGTDTEEKEADEEPEKLDKAPAPEPEKKEVPDFAKQIKDLEEKYALSQKGNAALAAENRKLKKEGKPEKPKLTDDQIMGVLDEHRDDPKMMFRVIKHMVQEGTATAEKSAERVADIREKKQSLTAAMQEVLPGVTEDGTPLNAAMRTTMSYLELDDNPYGEFLASAAMMFKHIPRMLKEREAAIRAEYKTEPAEEKRKAAIKNKTLSDTDKESGKKPLPKTADETARKLGMNDRQRKIYERILKGESA